MEWWYWLIVVLYSPVIVSAALVLCWLCFETCLWAIGLFVLTIAYSVLFVAGVIALAMRVPKWIVRRGRVALSGS